MKTDDIIANIEARAEARGFMVPEDLKSLADRCRLLEKRPGVHGAKAWIRQVLCANMFDGHDSGTTTMRVDHLLDDAADILAPHFPATALSKAYADSFHEALDKIMECSAALYKLLNEKPDVAPKGFTPCHTLNNAVGRIRSRLQLLGFLSPKHRATI